ncbi:MAG: hypothetical protein ACLP9L_22245 [Thermoguttaceae bacterium]
MSTATAGREHLHVMIPAPEKKRFDRLVTQQRRKKYEVVADAIREYLAAHERPTNRIDRRPK